MLSVSDLHYRLPHYDWLVKAAEGVDVVALVGDLADVVNPVPIDVQTVVLDRESLATFRRDFPVHLAADDFELRTPA